MQALQLGAVIGCDDGSESHNHGGEAGVAGEAGAVVVKCAGGEAGGEAGLVKRLQPTISVADLKKGRVAPRTDRASRVDQQDEERHRWLTDRIDTQSLQNPVRLLTNSCSCSTAPKAFAMGKRRVCP